MNKIQVVKSLILREPKQNWNKLHPNAQKVLTKMTQPLEPLEYPLKELPKDTAPKDVVNALGGTESLPFSILRTHVGNLPVYRKYGNNKLFKRTVIRHIQGDVDAFKRELTKIVSNAEVYEKVGRVEVRGFHKDSVVTWLTRLGF